MFYNVDQSSVHALFVDEEFGTVCIFEMYSELKNKYHVESHAEMAGILSSDDVINYWYVHCLHFRNIF